MAIQERQVDHKPPHLDYGPCPKHFLEEDARAKDLYEYVEEFLLNHADSEAGVQVHRTGQKGGVKTFVGVSKNEFGGAYNLSFFEENRPPYRRYRVESDSLCIVYPFDTDGSGLYSQRRTNGDDAWFKEHVLFITAELRAAGILILPENQKPRQ